MVCFVVVQQGKTISPSLLDPKISKVLGAKSLDQQYTVPHTLHGTGIYAYIHPPNHPNVGKYSIHGASDQLGLDHRIPSCADR